MIGHRLNLFQCLLYRHIRALLIYINISNINKRYLATILAVSVCAD